MVEKFDPVVERLGMSVATYRVHHRPYGPHVFAVCLRFSDRNNRWVLWFSAPGHSFGDLLETFASEDLMDALAFATKLVERDFHRQQGITPLQE